MINRYECKRLPFGWRGITLCPFIFYSDSEADVPDWLRKHEEYHWHHQLRWLVIPWLVVYGLLWLWYGYQFHPWEIAAGKKSE